MPLRPQPLLALALALPLLAGCSASTTSALTSRPSTGIATSALSATFQVSADGDEVTVSAAFQTPDATIVLADDDAVYVDDVRLEDRNGFLGRTVERKPAGQVYHFELRRRDGVTAVDVPALTPITVASPAAASELGQTRPVTITWVPSPGTRIEGQLLSTCATTQGRAEAESGSLTLPAFVPVGSSSGPSNAAPPPCDGTLSLVRTWQALTRSSLATTAVVSEETDRVDVRIVP